MLRGGQFDRSTYPRGAIWRTVNPTYSISPAAASRRPVFRTVWPPRCGCAATVLNSSWRDLDTLTRLLRPRRRHGNPQRFNSIIDGYGWLSLLQHVLREVLEPVV